MKVNYKFINEGNGNFKIQSNLKSNGLDMLDILSSDVVESSYKDFLDCIKNKKRWWSNATRVEFFGNEATIYPAFDWSDETETKINIEAVYLKAIIVEWINFLRNERSR